MPECPFSQRVTYQKGDSMNAVISILMFLGDVVRFDPYDYPTCTDASKAADAGLATSCDVCGDSFPCWCITRNE